MTCTLKYPTLLHVLYRTLTVANNIRSISVEGKFDFTLNCLLRDWYISFIICLTFWPIASGDTPTEGLATPSDEAESSF